MRKTNLPETRIKILEAASEVVLNHGVINLTLDTVARIAGVSKGGLLYHFPSKEALVEGMIEQLGQAFTTAMWEQHDTCGEEGGTGEWCRAYARATLNEPETERQLTSALLAAVAINPELLAPLREQYRGWQQRMLNDGLDPALATVIRLAVDGLWMAELLGLAQPEEPLRAQVVQRIIELTRKEERS